MYLSIYVVIIKWAYASRGSLPGLSDSTFSDTERRQAYATHATHTGEDTYVRDSQFRITLLHNALAVVKKGGKDI